MKLKMTLKGMLILGIVLLTHQAIAGEPLVLKSRQDKVNYGIGVDIARKLIQQGGEINLDTVVMGMKHVLSGEKLLMTDEDIRISLVDLQTEMIQRQQQAAIKQEGIKTVTAGSKTTAVNAGPGANAEKQKKQPRMTARNGNTELIVPNTANVTTAEQYEVRRTIKSRAADIRQRTIERELGGTKRAGTRGPI